MPGASVFGLDPGGSNPWPLFIEKVRRLLPGSLEAASGGRRCIELALGGLERFLELHREFTDAECRALIAHVDLDERQLLALLDHPRAGVRAGLLHHDHPTVVFVMDADREAGAVSRSLVDGW